MKDQKKTKAQLIAELQDLRHRLNPEMGLDGTKDRHADKALRESLEEYRTLFENMVQGVFYQRADGVLIGCNPAALDMFGLTSDEFLGWNSLDQHWKMIHEDGSDFPGGQHPSMQALQTGKPVLDVTAGVFNPRKQDYVWLSINAIPQFKEGEDKPGQVFVTLHDITERKRLEYKHNRINRALRVISACNRKLVTVTNEIDWLNELCRIVVDEAGFRMAWVGYAEHDRKKRVCPIAQAGFEAGYLETVNISWADVKRGRGPTGTAIRTGQPVIARNIPSDPDFGPWRRAAIQRGYASSIALPLIANEATLGALNIYAAEADAFDSEEVELLRQLAGDLAYGIEALRTRQQKQQAEAELRESEARFHALFEFSLDAVLLTAPDGSIISANPAACQMFGRTENEICQLGRNGVVDTSDPRLATALKERAHTGSFKGELTFIREDGSKFPGEISSVIFRDRAGHDRTSIIIRDITRRKLVEEALRESEEKHRRLFETVSEAIFMLSGETAAIMEVNQAAVTLYQYSREEMLKMNAIELSAEPDESSKMLGDQTGRIPLRYHRKKDGTIFPVEILYSDFDHRGLPMRIAAVRDITKRRQAEEAVIATKTFLDRVVDMSPFAMWISDEKGTIIRTNRSLRETLNLTDDEILGAYNIFKDVNLEIQGVMPQVRAVFEQQTPARFSIPWKAAQAGKDEFNRGRDMCIDVSMFPILDSQNRLTHVVCQWIDITELKEAEEALRRQVRMNIAFFTQSTQCFVLFDRNHKFIRVNDAFANYFGKKAEAFSGRTYDDLYPANTQYHDRTRSLFDDMVRTRQPIQFFARPFIFADQPDRATTYWDWTFQPILDERGEVEFFFFSAHDVTERKKAGEALLESEEKYRNLIQQSGDAIYLLYNRRFELINQKFQEMFGFTPENINQPAFDFINLVAPKSRPMIEERMQRFAAGEKLDSNYEFTALDARGKEIEVEASVAYIKYKDGIATQGVLRDVTVRKKLEAQLRRSQKLETIGTLAGGIAHDFNNLLTPILGYADLALLSLYPSDPLTNDLEQIIIAANRAKELVEQILIFSRQMEKERKPLSLHLIVREIVKLLRPSSPSTIEIRQRIDSTCAKVLADASQMHQVIMNLCTNAFQAMEKDGGTLTIELQPVKVDRATVKMYPSLKEADYVRLSITDTGTGMDEATLNRIFEPFFTTKAPGKGTGMGLSVVHGIVRSHLGEIIVRSEPGQGSIFQVYLPTTKDECENDNQTQITIERGQETILVVDDEDAIVCLLKKILKRLGYQVDGYHSSIEALKMYQVQPSRYNLVISDLTMPGLTGLDLARQIHILEKNIPIIIMTGYSENVPLDIQAAHGIRNIIGKPIAFKNLASIIRKTLDN